MTSEKIGILQIELPEPSDNYYFIAKRAENFSVIELAKSDNRPRNWEMIFDNLVYKCTKLEAENNFPQFKWVSLTNFLVEEKR